MDDSSAAILTFLSEASEKADELFSNERKIRDVSELNVDLTTREAYSACKNFDWEANTVNKSCAYSAVRRKDPFAS